MPRPKLPLETEAEIERAKEKLNSTAPKAHILMLQTEFFASMGSGSSSRPLRKPAQLKLALRKYASTLFDCEAGFYLRHAASDDELRSWLNGLAGDIESEAVAEIASGPGGMNEFHCSADEQKKEISDALEERVDYWVETAARARRNSFELALLKGKMEPIRPLGGRTLMPPPSPVHAQRVEEIRSPAATVETATDIIAQHSRARVEAQAQKEIALESAKRLTVTSHPAIPGKPEVTVASQIEDLRLECGLTQQALSDALGLDVRTVQRHLRGESTPQRRIVAMYEKHFSKRLNRNVFISKMP